MKTVFVTDSTFYMNKAIVEKYNIKQVPLMINFNDKTYKEDQYNLAQTKEIFDRIDATKELPKTSQPATDAWISVFSELKKEGYERIIVLTISVEISGTLQGAQAAANMFMEYNDVEILVFDSKSDAQGSGIVLCDILREVDRRGELSKEDIQEIIDWHAQVMRIFLLVDDLKYLAYGGRIPTTIANVGNALRIKPIIHIPAGKLLEHSKHISRKKAIKAIVDIFSKDSASVTTPMYFSAGDLFNETDLLQSTEMLKENANTELIELPYSSFGSVIGVHIGPGTIAFGYTIPYEYHEQIDKSYYLD